MLCNDTKVAEDGTLTGDPTETALIDMGFKLDFDPAKFNAYPRVNEIPFDSERKLMTTVVKEKYSYFIDTKGGVDELLRKCNRYIVNGEIKPITEEFEKIPNLYIADGHHRSAAAALVGAEKAAANPNHTGEEEYNYFMAVAFPASHLNIIDYNRVVKDLNGLTPAEFLDKLSENFIVEDKGTEIYTPSALHNFSLYLDGKWHSLTAKAGTFNDSDPIGVLDVTVSSDLILRDILNITDLRSDKRIDFVGGIRGLGELKRRVDSGEMAMALALYPVTMDQLINIADTGNIMPPKTTWFEPKLRSGLVIHKLDD